MGNGARDNENNNDERVVSEPRLDVIILYIGDTSVRKLARNVLGGEIHENS